MLFLFIYTKFEKMRTKTLLFFFLLCSIKFVANASNDTIPKSFPHNILLDITAIDSLNKLDTLTQEKTLSTASGDLLMNYLQLPLVAEKFSSFLYDGWWKISMPEIPHKIQVGSQGIFQSAPDISEMIADVELAERALSSLQRNRLDLFTISRSELEPFGPDYSYIKSNDNLSIKGDALSNHHFKLDKINGKTLKRQYWFLGMETSLQFSQNYISENWYKGGSSNLNIMFSNRITYEYKRNKIRWKNEMENRLSIFNAAKDSVNRYRVAEDLFRLRSNIGYKAFSKWFYSFDAEASTQLFTNRAENSLQKHAAFLSPVLFNTGIGLKYELDKKSTRIYGRAIKIGLFLSPLSYNLKWSLRDDVDLARHGFPKGKQIVHQIGSTIKAELIWHFDSRISWQSRLYANTNYETTVGEFENMLNFSLTRFLSTRLYLYMRYDDSVTRPDEKSSFLQVNELISIGLYYRW